MNFIFFFLGIIMTAQAKLPSIDEVWNFQDPKDSQQKFETLLQQVRQEKSTSAEFELEVITQIGRTLALQRKFSEAHQQLDLVKNRLTKNTRLASVRYNLERGRVFNSSQKKTEARPHFLQAYEEALKIENGDLAVDALHMMAIIEAEPEKQMEWNLKAVQLAETSKDPAAAKWLGSLYNNIGWTYHSEKKFDLALDMFKKALAFRESKKVANPIRIAKWCVARTYRSLSRTDEALKVQLELKKEYDGLPVKDGYVYEELGELYLLKDNKKEAQAHFALAYQELSKDEWFKANEEKRLMRIKNLAEEK